MIFADHPLALTGALAIEYKHSKGWDIIGEFHTFVKPKVKVSAGVPHNITGGTKPFEEGPGSNFTAFCRKHLKNSNGVIAAHNGRRYDHRILYFHKFRPPFKVEMADTIDWFKAKNPGLPSVRPNSLQSGFNPVV